jgi:hypothetical protein
VGAPPLPGAKQEGLPQGLPQKPPAEAGGGSRLLLLAASNQMHSTAPRFNSPAAGLVG